MSPAGYAGSPCPDRGLRFFVASIVALAVLKVAQAGGLRIAGSIFQSESEPEIDIYFQRGMSLKVGFVSSAR